MATVVFVGKSLTAEGGQNPVEPALAGKPAVFGPHMENFAVVARQLVDGEAAVQVRDVAGLEAAVEKLLDDSGLRAATGARASAILERHQGSANRTADLILEATRSSL